MKTLFKTYKDSKETNHSKNYKNVTPEVIWNGHTGEVNGYKVVPKVGELVQIHISKRYPHGDVHYAVIGKVIATKNNGFKYVIVDFAGNVKKWQNYIGKELQRGFTYTEYKGV